MSAIKEALALLLSLCLFAQPTIAQVRGVVVEVPAQAGGQPVVVQVPELSRNFTLQSPLSNPAASLPGSSALKVNPTVHPTAGASASAARVSQALVLPVSAVSVSMAMPAASAGIGAQMPPLSKTREVLGRRLQKLTAAVDEAGKALADNMGADGSRSGAERLIRLLTHEKGIEANGNADLAVVMQGDSLSSAGNGNFSNKGSVDRKQQTPGQLTLKMLERFTQDGPAPAARGDAFLYAQGAKPLPAGLESSGSARSYGRPRPGDKLERVMLMRRNGRVSLAPVAKDGKFGLKSAQVPAQLAQGIVGDTLVEVSYSNQEIHSIKPVGASPADVIIGRVIRMKDGSLRLTSVFQGDPAKELYAPLPVVAGPAAKEGSFLQAFVRPAKQGFEAVPLLDLGNTLTPEIAAREVALRHGARGYFEEAVIRQVEETARAYDPAADFRRIQGVRGRVEDLRALPFVTIDPVGAGDLDDAYYIRKEADGGYAWYLATSDVAQYVKPGTPAFRAAARVGNTFYSMDKDGVPEYPMNHPVVSKYVSSLLAGKDSVAMISKMRFSPSGEFILDQSEVFLGLIHVQGRYTYDQVAAFWKGYPDHVVGHAEQISLARELSAKLQKADLSRGKLSLDSDEIEHRKGKDGRWATSIVDKSPLVEESHKIIEELKIYGNITIDARLERLEQRSGVKHISRVHPSQDEKINADLRRELERIGVPWSKEQALADYLADLKKREDIPHEVQEVARMLALRTRKSALYAVEDTQGHEGLALEANTYAHPSTPIRRFSDMYNRALTEAELEGRDPKAAEEAMLADLRAMGFKDLRDYLGHLNGREQASRQMDREVDEFMSVYELSKPENRGRTFTGYVKSFRAGRTFNGKTGDSEALIQLREVPISITQRGDLGYGLLDEVSVKVKGADPASLKVAADVRVLRKYQVPTRSSPPSSSVVNDEGIQIVDEKVAQYYAEIRRMVEVLKSRGLDLSESLDVMNDSYADIWAKLKAVELIARDRDVGNENTHLEQSLFWVDATIKDNGRTAAIHTSRVYFHHAKNPASEIREGIRRTDQALRDMTKNFARAGKAEQALGPIDEVILVFDTRGYGEIKQHLRRAAAELAKIHGDRYRFLYLDEMAAMPPTPEEMRRELNAMVERYQKSDLNKIINGVIYGRYVGLLLELRTLEYFVNNGYKVLQSGRDMLDADGIYITELDAVVQSLKDGAISIVESKSARVPLPADEVLKDKVLYKLDAYKKNEAWIKSLIGLAPEAALKVVFAFDVGRNQKLKSFLSSQEDALSRRYGFQVSFVFLDTMPQEGKPGRLAPESGNTQASRAPPTQRSIKGQPALDEKLPPGAKSATIYYAKTPEDIQKLIPENGSIAGAFMTELEAAVSHYGDLKIVVYEDGAGGEFIGLDLQQKPGWLNHIPQLEKHEKALIRKILDHNPPDVKVVIREAGMTPDLIVGGVVTELKSVLTVLTDGVLMKHLDKANRQVIAFSARHGLGSGHLAVDLTLEKKVPVERMERVINAWASESKLKPVLARIWIYSQGDMQSFVLQKDGTYRLRDKSLETDPLNQPMETARISGLIQEGYQSLESLRKVRIEAEKAGAAAERALAQARREQRVKDKEAGSILRKLENAAKSRDRKDINRAINRWKGFQKMYPESAREIKPQVLEILRKYGISKKPDLALLNAMPDPDPLGMLVFSRPSFQQFATVV